MSYLINQLYASDSKFCSKRTHFVITRTKVDISNIDFEIL